MEMAPAQGVAVEDSAGAKQDANVINRALSHCLTAFRHSCTHLQSLAIGVTDAQCNVYEALDMWYHTAGQACAATSIVEKPQAVDEAGAAQLSGSETKVAAAAKVESIDNKILQALGQKFDSVKDTMKAIAGQVWFHCKSDCNSSPCVPVQHPMLHADEGCDDLQWPGCLLVQQGLSRCLMHASDLLRLRVMFDQITLACRS
jgi:hypothetical protein